MDLVALFDSILNKGGPMVVVVIMGGLMYLQHLSVASIKKNLDNMSEDFNSFKIIYANEKVRKNDLDEIKQLIKEHNAQNRELFTRVFERLDMHATRCGTDCLASLHARAELNNAVKK